MITLQFMLFINKYDNIHKSEAQQIRHINQQLQKYSGFTYDNKKNHNIVLKY